MRGQLSIEIRQKTVITRLKNSVFKLSQKIKELGIALKAKDKLITELEAKLINKESQRQELLTYLYKPNKELGVRKPRGKKPGSLGYHRPNPPESSVTEEHSYLLKRCPMCQKSVGDVVDTVTKYEEDITLVPQVTIKKFVIARHWCAHCETYVKSNKIPQISRIGKNVLAYILYARYRLHLPISKIQESLRDLHSFKISEGEIVAKLKEAEQFFGQDYASICELIKDAKCVYADETGWRMDGENWYLWVFVTSDGKTRFVIEESRGKGVAEDKLGSKQDRIIISDGYAVYNNLSGFHQQCWVHLLRAAKLRSPTLYTDLAVLYQKLLLELEKDIIQRDKAYFEKALENLIKKKYPEPLAPKAQARIQRQFREFLTCLDFEGVKPENNTAERALRPQVIMRKIFGGSRSLAGARAHEVNSSVLTTLKNQNPDQNFVQVLAKLIKKRHSGL